MNSHLPSLIARVREHTPVALAVGFGVSTREHFQTVADAGADAVVVGSRVVTVIKTAPQGQAAEAIKRYCIELTTDNRSHTTPPPPTPSQIPDVAKDTPQQTVSNSSSANEAELPARFGQFGGQYVPEALVDCLLELENAHKAASADPTFWAEFQEHYGYINRPSNLYLAQRLTDHCGGANIWFKREDLSVFLTSFDRLRFLNFPIVIIQDPIKSTMP